MTSLRRRPMMLAAGLALSALLTACGSSSSGGSPSASSGGATVTSGPTVTIKDFKFTPATLNVKVGTKVTFIQEDSIPHNATAQGTNAFKTPTMTKGQKFTVTFSKAGTYNYICDIHQYMKGTVVVR